MRNNVKHFEKKGIIYNLIGYNSYSQIYYVDFKNNIVYYRFYSKIQNKTFKKSIEIENFVKMYSVQYY